jgi:hypothetical protein
VRTFMCISLWVGMQSWPRPLACSSRLSLSSRKGQTLNPYERQHTRYLLGRSVVKHNISQIPQIGKPQMSAKVKYSSYGVY